VKFIVLSELFPGSVLPVDIADASFVAKTPVAALIVKVEFTFMLSSLVYGFPIERSYR
jgi:hypothetical protein